MSVVRLNVLKEPEATKEDLDELERARPKKRGDCVGEKEQRMKGESFCPFVSCKYNTFLRVTQLGLISTAYENIEDYKSSNCVLDYEGGADPAQVAHAIGVSYQAARSLIDRFIDGLRRTVNPNDFELPKCHEGNLAGAQDYGW